MASMSPLRGVAVSALQPVVGAVDTQTSRRQNLLTLGNLVSANVQPESPFTGTLQSQVTSANDDGRGRGYERTPKPLSCPSARSVRTTHLRCF